MTAREVRDTIVAALGRIALDVDVDESVRRATLTLDTTDLSALDGALARLEAALPRVSVRWRGDVVVARVHW